MDIKQNSKLGQNYDITYPYGQFPYEHTINGQNALKERLNKQNTQNISIQTNDSSYLDNKYEINDEYKPIKQNNSLDIKKLLPLFIKMQKGNINQNDMLQFLLPLLGINDLPIKDLMTVFNQSTSAEKKESSVDIDSIKPCSE